MCIICLLLQVQSVTQLKASYAAAAALGTDAAHRLAALVAEGSTYNRLAASIAPEIFGHEDVKKVRWERGRLTCGAKH